MRKRANLPGLLQLPPRPTVNVAADAAVEKLLYLDETIGFEAQEILAADAPTFPATLVPGKSAPLSVLITNNGNIAAKASNFQVSFFASSTAGLDARAVLLTAPVRAISLQPGKSRVFKASLMPFSLAAGNDFIVAQIDSSSVFADSDLTNNIASSASEMAVL